MSPMRSRSSCLIACNSYNGELELARSRIDLSGVSAPYKFETVLKL